MSKLLVDRPDLYREHQYDTTTGPTAQPYYTRCTRYLTLLSAWGVFRGIRTKETVAHTIVENACVYRLNSHSQSTHHLTALRYLTLQSSGELLLCNLSFGPYEAILRNTVYTAVENSTDHRYLIRCPSLPSTTEISITSTPINYQLHSQRLLKAL